MVRLRRPRLILAFCLVLLLSAACTGVWNVNASPSPVRAIHVAVLRTGKVLLVAGSGNEFYRFEAGDFQTSLWDPATNNFSPVTTPWDAFCSGHAFLGDGRLLVAGGTLDFPQTAGQSFAGSRKAYLFDPVSATYQRVPDMAEGRWYPSLVTLGNGSVLTVGGLDESRNRISTAQRFTGTGWTTPTAPPTGLPNGWPLYPSLHLLADGRLFYSGVNTFGTVGSAPGIWNLATNTLAGVPGLTDVERRDQGMSVLLPPAQNQQVMVMGGGDTGDSNDAVASTAIVDLDASATPAFVPGPALSEPKMYVSAVVLPDSTVVETGGSRKSREAVPPGTGSTFSTQIYDPGTGKLTTAPPSTLNRGYHSSAVLLPDGRVATFGGNPNDNSFELRIEIYTPGYMFRSRPVIASVPTELTRGTPISLTASGTNPVTSAVLVRPMAVTHSFDPEQRLVDVPFTATPTGGQITVPTNANLLPPGWYMLFARDAQRTPSVAKWVHVS